MYTLDEFYTNKKTLIDLIEKQKREINYLKQVITDLQNKR